ncbi:MAG: FtsX-like permease family protein [Gammaproteobacteria bacterium]|jgi:putative ABC transport system permease protein|nr:FtsX-like permease family protein [Gammaproteobacteria bacterium]
MFKNYLIVALRNLAKTRLYTTINIVGLAIGLAICVFSNVIVDHERSYDVFFPNADRIYSVYGIFTANAGIGVRSSGGIQTTVEPLIAAEVPGVEASSRLLAREYLVRFEDKKFYQGIRFADPDFTQIFQFEYLSGNPQLALNDPDSLILTESTARKLFGDDTAMGKVISVNNEHDLHVTAVIADIPKNSHFNNDIILDQPLHMISTTRALEQISSFKMEGNWDNMSSQDVVYVLLPEGQSANTVNQQLKDLYERHVPERNREFLDSFELRELKKLNLFIWETTGLPVLISIQILGLLILIIAIINYTNLATAQIMGRTREVGLRRAMGASRLQLFTQFMVESMAMTSVALVIAIVIIQLTLPILNDIAGKSISFNILNSPVLLAWLVLLTLSVGLISGWYPAYLISRSHPVGLLNGEMVQGKKAVLIRNIMLIAQFSIALFMIIAVIIIYTQNNQIEKTSLVFDKARILTLERFSRPEIKERAETLRTEFENLAGVESFALSSQVPYEQDHSTGKFSLVAGDSTNMIDLYRISIDRNFLQTYDIDLLSGRNLSRAYAQDTLLVDDEYNPIHDSTNVIVNQLVLSKLKISDSESAIGQRFYRHIEDSPIPVVEYNIVGVIPNRNFLGFHNEIKPIVFANRPQNQRTASLKLKGQNITHTLAEIDSTWDRLVPEFPIEKRFLDEYFNDVFKIFKGINAVLAGFAIVALIVALIGLFGMAAFMSERRTREVGVRKVMGASVSDIVILLIWQFSQPVFIAIIIATPLAYFAASLYLNFFADQAEFALVWFLGADASVLILTSIIVAIHAIKVASTRPIKVLRYE